MFMRCPLSLIKMQANPCYEMIIVNGIGNGIGTHIGNGHLSFEFL